MCRVAVWIPDKALANAGIEKPAALVIAAGLN